MNNLTEEEIVDDIVYLTETKAKLKSELAEIQLRLKELTEFLNYNSKKEAHYTADEIDDIIYCQENNIIMNEYLSSQTP